VVCIALKIIEIVAIWCQILSWKGSKFDFGWGSTPNPARGARSVPPDSLMTPSLLSAPRTSKQLSSSNMYP